ncbi:tellurite resistance TerB family protein [Neisseria sp. CCUG12390]|uniref:tellurite resistance TerB family protein n=1 Tax=Neisseria sp. CCUG12390 TaxID=3392035 RepID=UPI003A10133E
MNLNSLLNLVLNTVQKSGGKTAGANNGGLLGSLGGSAVAASLVSMLLKKKNTGSLAKVGSLAALGMLAYKGYQAWQKNNPAQAAPQQSDFEPTETKAEEQSRILLRTMIAAAASDGLIDENEKELISKESGDDPATLRWLAAEYANPASIADIAQAVGNDRALASGVYLAARVVCDDLSRKEIVFLAQLAEALNLDEELVEKLEQQLGL